MRGANLRVQQQREVIGVAHVGTCGGQVGLPSRGASMVATASGVTGVASHRPSESVHGLPESAKPCQGRV
jgi:hypothetical protein